MVRQALLMMTLALGLPALVACSGEEPAANADAPADAAKAERKPTVFDPQLQALEKAKGVEEELKKAQAERDKQMDEQSE